MPSPTRTTVISANNSIPNSLTHTQQFQELVFAFKEWLVASGGAILRSNGGGVCDDTDNISSASDVTMGASGAGAWFVVEFAAGTVSNGVHRMLCYVNDASDPRQNFEFRAGPGSFTAGTGSTVALPTLTGVWTTAEARTLHPFTDLRNLRWSSWRTTSPNRPQRFIVKQEGVASANVWYELVSNDGANGSGNERWAWLAIFNGSDAVVGSLVGTATNWASLDASGSADAVTDADASIWTIAASWTSGTDGFGNAHPQPILVGQTAATGRALGTIVDVYAVPQSSAFGVALDAAEVSASQDPLRVVFGDAAFYWPNGVTIE